ncbi:MAG: DUF983 domain-containing protein [Phenylobacterium sp.]|jgi:uncharacterized protein (DUF983 family)|uniref:DUF983 domain-containing protein n=1 Tax=Phenylobacterium ferrooxidans TaxID=2982689 RepID=A0ABW6CVB2_9CAUL|nr:DUF983 domain-containing protein [Phenylobacterium sp.]MDO8322990.1 DUF983 domain-containing protein [Phenylobacterium sp.]MDO8912073.1 DUF983 domain-containing protein [Phenylobacterium sp.]MDO9247193.1 DUF983 domain-containing protein [Phenylobacterium sp.]MDP3100879.1 DUF983 domain-containing protein [Phenylobacterium sp.]MDP3635021.1 DUF983 domain-containing protein [Phenylobacterium sp.]
MRGHNPLLAGLAGRCPNCGEGPLFSGFLTVAARCEACGYDLAKADSGDGPAVFVILIAGFLACFGALFTQFSFDPPVWLTMIIWLPLTLFLCLGLLRPMKGLMLAAQFANRASEARHDGQD